ncbi:MAG: prepilin-type N-terminal cleavage/methylation domain-containing protein [PVC group bacterium]|nr:prepilin-type N-terminal cleavage/methylation domain-containing protein [PVC group bacterium]
MLRNKGFTLIELLFVVLILGILSGIALFRPGLDFVRETKVRTTAQRLVSDLRLARRLAITNNENYKLTVYRRQLEYKIFDSNNNQSGSTRTVYPGFKLKRQTNFIFEPLGNLSSSSGTRLSVSDGTTTYEIAIISATGSISMAK